MIEKVGNQAKVATLSDGYDGEKTAQRQSESKFLEVHWQATILFLGLSADICMDTGKVRFPTSAKQLGVVQRQPLSD